MSEYDGRGRLARLLYLGLGSISFLASPRGLLFDALKVKAPHDDGTD